MEVIHSNAELASFSHSDQIDKIAAALAKAQTEYPEIKKEKTAKVKGKNRQTGQTYEYEFKYADLGDILPVMLPVMAKHGIAVIQPPVIHGQILRVKTRIIFEDQWMECEYPVTNYHEAADHQKIGGALTYARRQSFCSLVGVVAETENAPSEATAEARGGEDRKPAPARQAPAKPKPEVVQGAQAGKPLPPVAGELDEEESLERLQGIVDDLTSANTIDELVKIGETWGMAYKMLHEAHRKDLDGLISEASEALGFDGQVFEK